MDAIYYISVTLMALGLPALLVYLVIALIKPRIVHRFTKNPWSRKRIAGVGAASVFGMFIMLGVVQGMAMPESVRAEMATQRQLEVDNKLREERQEKERLEKEREAAEAKKKPVVKTEKTTSVIRFTSSEKEDASVSKGQRVTSVAGVDGEKTDIYEVTYVEGRQVSKKLSSTEVTREPVNEVVSVGTYVAPSPAPAPALAPRPVAAPAAPSSGGGGAYYKNCTEARAAGVAPIYEGQPGYRPALDRDRDGVACE